MYYHEGPTKHKAQGLGDWNGFPLTHGDLFVLGTSLNSLNFAITLKVVVAHSLNIAPKELRKKRLE